MVGFYLILLTYSRLSTSTWLFVYQWPRVEDAWKLLHALPVDEQSVPALEGISQLTGFEEDIRDA